MNIVHLCGLASMAVTAVFTWWACTSNQSGPGQTRRGAVIEAWVNIAIGFGINFVANLFILPLVFGISPSHSDNFWMGWIYTAVSVVRSFAIRRYFNARIVAFAQRVAR